MAPWPLCHHATGEKSEISQGIVVMVLGMNPNWISRIRIISGFFAARIKGHKAKVVFTLGAKRIDTRELIQ